MRFRLKVSTLLFATLLVANYESQAVGLENAIPSGKSWTLDSKATSSVPTIYIQDLQSHFPWRDNFPKSNRLIFPPCMTSGDSFCIESIEGRIGTEAEWLSFSPGIELHPTFDLSRNANLRNLPLTFARLWNSPPELATSGGSEYLVRATAEDFNGLHFGITPVARKDQMRDPGQCIQTYEETPCLTVYNHPKDSQFRMRIRIGAVVKQKSLFITSKTYSPTAAYSEINKQEILEISGSPAINPTGSANPPIELFAKQFPWLPLIGEKLNQDIPIQRIDGSSFQRFEQNTSFGFRQSLGEITVWHFDLLNLGTVKCLKSEDNEIGGLISSNALAMALEPPQWDEKLKELTYRIGSTHLLSDSTVNMGFFTAVFSSRAAECFWGRGFDKNRIRIIVTSESGKNQVAVTSIYSSSKNLYLHASGFHYSTNKVSISIATEAKTLPSQRILTISCVKGKMLKKISGNQPKCPAGYKLKR